MQTLNNFLKQFSENFPEIQLKIIITIFLILLFWILKYIIARIIKKQKISPQRRYRWSKTTHYSLMIIFIIFIGRLWFKGIQSITTLIGLMSAGIFIALRDPLVNLAGWAFILWRRPFKVGDRIQISNYAGDIIDLDLFQFTILEIGNWVDADQSTGRIIHIPNGKVFNEMQANYGKAFQYIWNEIPVLITFESNWEKAKKNLIEIAKNNTDDVKEIMENQIHEASKKYYIHYNKLSPIVYTSVRDSGILLTIRYLCNPYKRRGSENQIWEAILIFFKECPDIDFAYPTQRFYNNQTEGKTK